MENPKAAGALDQYVGGRIRMRRMLIGMSQEKLGEALGVSFQQVQKYEKGANRIGITRLTEIAAALGTTVSYFLDGAPGASSLTPPAAASEDLDRLTEILGTKDGLAVVQGFLQISPEARRAVADLVRLFAKSSERESVHP